MKRAYYVLLRLYPRDYRALLAREMQIAFQAAAEELSRNAYLRFCFTEFGGLLMGALAEWVAKLTTDSAIRGRTLPDRMLMRPPGVCWKTHYAGNFPDELSNNSSSFATSAKGISLNMPPACSGQTGGLSNVAVSE